MDQYSNLQGPLTADEFQVQTRDTIRPNSAITDDSKYRHVLLRAGHPQETAWLQVKHAEYGSALGADVFGHGLFFLPGSAGIADQFNRDFDRDCVTRFLAFIRIRSCWLFLYRPLPAL